MLAILKLLAWSERHSTVPRKDSSDLILILKNYLNSQNTERLYAEAPHLLEADGFDYEVAGAWLAGRDAALAIVGSSPESDRLLKIVQATLITEVDPDSRLRLIGELGSDAPAALHLLRGFLQGFCDH